MASKLFAVMRRVTIVYLLLATATFALAQSAPSTKPIYFTATDKNGTPAVLTPEQLESASGIKLKSLQPFGAVPISYVLVLDISNSEAPRFAGELDAARKILASVVRPNVDDGLLVAFDTQSYLGKSMTQDPMAMTAALNNFKAGGGSALYDALVQASRRLEKLAPVDKPRVMFLFSDGEDNQSRTKLGEAVAALLLARVHVYSMLLSEDWGQTRGRRILQALADETGGMLIDVTPSGRNSANMVKPIKTLQSEFNSWIRAEFEIEKGAEKATSYQLKLRSRDKAVTVHAPGWYLIEKEEPSASPEPPKTSQPVVK